MTASKHFESPRDTLAWVDESVQKLGANCLTFLNDENFRQVVEPDPQTGLIIIKVKLVRKLPAHIRGMATDIINNIKHSFDQSIYAACCAIGKKPKDSIYFPWADSPDDLEGRLQRDPRKPGKNVPPPPEFWPALRELQPYGRGNSYAGGDDLIRELAKIANRKHTINLTFTMTVSGIDHKISGDIGQMNVPIPRWDPVENEIVVTRVSADSKLDYNYKLQRYVSFNEAAPLKDTPLVESLMYFAAKAKTVLERLEEEANRIISV